MGYIYIRSHISYEDTYKLGKTSNIPERESQYITGELRRGKFKFVFKVDDETQIEKLLQEKFKDLNIRYNGGTEFYNKKITKEIETYFIENKIEYTKLIKKEIKQLLRKNRLKAKQKNKEAIPYIRKNNLNNKLIEYKPRDYQLKIINKAINHLKNNNDILLSLPCGTGKTLMALMIADKLKVNSLIIGVPNLLLLYQWKNIVGECLTVSGNIDILKIKNYIKNKTQFIIITSYASSYKVHKATKDLNIDMQINDESHHLAEGLKSYSKILNIKSNKQIYLSATPNNTDLYQIKKSVIWAINKNIICDYLIQIIIPNEEIEKGDKLLYLSAFCAIKSLIENTHHLLIYSNSKSSSVKIIKYINEINKKFNIELYSSEYNSDMNFKEQKNILNQFENSKLGIISCVYCLGEGWDFPLLDGVIFSENMESNVRIVQSILRASRKNKNEPDKITKIILPILDIESNDLNKIKQVIYQLGLEDETIENKIKVYNTKTNNISKKIKYNDTLTNDLKLKQIKREDLISYNKIKEIIRKKNIKTKDEYYNYNLPNPENYKEFTDWIDLLNIERNYYDLETCKEKVQEYLIQLPKLNSYKHDKNKICSILCEFDSLFPPSELWEEYYNESLGNIIVIDIRKKLRPLDDL